MNILLVYKADFLMKKMNVDCNECYIVNLSYKKKGNKWSEPVDELIIIHVHDINMLGNNYDEAEQKAREKYEDCIIYSVSLQ